VPYETTAVETPEELTPGEEPQALAIAIAAEKAEAAWALLSATEREQRLIVACDTIVVLDGEVLGKPADLEDAYRMLRALSGRTHQVVTAVALLDADDREPEAFAVTTRVRMRELSEADIDEWAAKGELLGCAGAYNIESQIASVDEDECFQNVAGLPLCHLYRTLAERGLAEVESPVNACDELRCASCVLGRKLGGEE